MNGCAKHTSVLLVAVGVLGLALLPAVRSFTVPQPRGLSEERIKQLARIRYQANPDDELPMEGRVAVITGAAGGIGNELCKVVHSLGATVVAMDRDTAGLERLQESFRGDDEGRFLPFTTNQEDLASVSRVADEIISRFRKIDLLVCNAGLAYPTGLVPGSPRMVSAHGKDLAFTVNYLSHVLLTEKLRKALSSSSSSGANHGRIVHLTSTFHWKVDGSELVPAPDGTGPLAFQSDPGKMSPEHVARSYANTKLAQIWHSRCVGSTTAGCSSVCACPTWAATGIAGEGARGFLEAYAFAVADCGPGLTSALNAILRTDEELGDALNNGRSFVANSRILERLVGVEGVLTSGLTRALGLRDALTTLLAAVLLVGQRYTHDDFIVQRTSPESYNDEETRREFYRWSLNEIQPWLS